MFAESFDEGRRLDVILGIQDMKTESSKGSTFTWTLKSPSMTALSSEEFEAFVDAYLDNVDKNAFIKGDVIYNDGETAIVEIKEMTNGLFPFTLFYNEVKNRYPDLDKPNDDPCQKYFCLDIASMTSLFFYDVYNGYLADAEYNADGSFCTYNLLDDVNDVRPDGGYDAFIEDITLQLPQEEIESMEDQEAICQTGDAEITDNEGNLIPQSDPCSVARAVSWFNTKDCAILTAWRNGKARKTNDDNNRKLQQQLREFGYGVIKITGWYPEKNKELARENSFLTVNLNEKTDFRDNIYKLSECYEQDCFLYKEAGYDTPAIYVYTNDDCGKGKVKLIGRLHIDNMDAEAFSQIKTGRITFE